tara:strand:+ start:3620 stop:4162 length:543 start_codon:yes stop_codon:yes gene_type:complete
MHSIADLAETKFNLIEKHANNYVVSVSGCWEYQGYIHRGYGSAKLLLNGSRCHLKAHRLAYYYHYNLDPAPLLVCHHCDNRRCVNPKHLYIGTHEDNMNDVVVRGRQRGSNNTFSKLTEEMVLAIKKRIETKEKYKDIAADYNIKPCTIADISTQRSWKHIQLPSNTKELYKPHQFTLAL